MLKYDSYLELEQGDGKKLEDTIWDRIESWKMGKMCEETVEFDDECYQRFEKCRALNILFWKEHPMEGENANILYSEKEDWITVYLHDESEWDWKKFCAHSKNLRYLAAEKENFEKIPKEFLKLKNLRYLELCGSNLEKGIKGIEKLQSLEYLNLNNAKLTELPEEIGLLQRLEVLVLMETGISHLPRSIGQLKSLRYLGMNGTKIEKIPDVIFGLSELRSLYLGMTGICVLPDEMKNLKKLEHLALWETQIEELPDWICDFTELRGLYLGRDCRIQKLPKNIGNLTKLEKLYLDGTGLSELPNSFGNLAALKRLQLTGTDIRKFPPILQMPNLEYCNLKNMTLERIPQEFIHISHGVSIQEEYVNRGLNLYGTKLLCQPISLFEHDKEFIEAYYAEEKIHLNETKVVFLGDGEAGKSHIIERIKNQGELLEKFSRKSTPGIEISQKNYQIETEDVCLQIWDFGGQEIMHSMHRFFLTDRTLYVIVLNARDNTQDERAKYWLNNIKSFANGCPVILVLNKMDQNPSASLNERLLMNDYPQIVSTIKMSALKDGKEQFNSLTEQILAEVKMFDSYAMEFPVSWNKVKNTLTEMEDNYIMDKDYREICTQNGITDEKIQNWLLDWFHDLGVSFNYRKKDELLGAYMVLKPQWITNAIYIILFNGTDEANNGMITKEKIIALLKKPPRYVENIHYRLEEVPYILGVMRRFEISYSVDEQTEFIPMMCDKNQHKEAEKYEKYENLEYFMEYRYLPNNVLHKLMIKMREDLVTEKIWLTGMILSAFGGKMSALVRMHNRRIEIFIKSQDAKVYPPKEYLFEIRKYLLGINQELNLIAEDMIIYKEGDVRDEIKYEDLLIHLSADRTEYFSAVFRKTIPVKKILGLVEDEYDMERILRLCKEDRNITYGLLRAQLETGEKEFSYKEFFEDLITDCTKVQGNTLLLQQGQENDRNTYLRDLLEAQEYCAQDQTLNGMATGGKRAGELDILIKNEKHRPMAVLEALNLKSIDKDYLGEHLRKVYSYDTWGAKCNYLVVYAECKDFAGFCKRYQKFVREFSYPYPLEKTEEDTGVYADMHVLHTYLRRNEKLTELRHLLVWMKP